MTTTTSALRAAGLTIKGDDDYGMVRYSDGRMQCIVLGAHPEHGRVIRYSNGDAETIVNVTR